jgi:hypothetical protein
MADALPTNVVSNYITFTLSAAGGSSPAEYQCDVTKMEEVVSTYGGDEIITACGVIRSPLRSTITGLKITMVQSKAATDLFRYLRETACAGTEVVTYSGNSTITEGATAPEWGGTVSGWTIPPLKTQASGGYPTTDVEFTFSAVAAVDVT